MLVLASKSPRRREILANAGFEFQVVTTDIPEVRRYGEDPLHYVRRLAQDKANAVSDTHRENVVLAADTVVVLDLHVLEKPRDADDVRRMLRLLSGRDHEVSTGICLRFGDRTIVDTETTTVHFVHLSEAEIDEYLASGEPMDKAGAYAIQGRASKFISRVEGCYFNVVGLPIALVYRYWKSLTMSAG
jgi:septum formation protein